MAGMFGGGKPDWGNALAAALAGWSAGAGNQAGAQALQMIHGNRLMRQRQALEDQNYQRQRQDGMQDWIAKQQYEAAHPAPAQPTQTDRYLEEFLNPATPTPRKAALGQILFPPVMSTVNGMPAIIDRAQMLQSGGQQAAPVGKLTPIEDEGGPALTPPATFPFRF